MFQKVKKRNILFFMQSHIHSFFLFLFTKGFHCSKEISSLSTFRTNRKFDSNDSTKAQNCLTSMILRSFISTRCIVCVEREVFPRWLIQLLSFDLSHEDLSSRSRWRTELFSFQRKAFKKALHKKATLQKYFFHVILWIKDYKLFDFKRRNIIKLFVHLLIIKIQFEILREFDFNEFDKI